MNTEPRPLREDDPQLSRELRQTLQALKESAREFKTLEFRCREAAKRQNRHLAALGGLLAQLGIKLDIAQPTGRHSDDRRQEGHYPRTVDRGRA